MLALAFRFPGGRYHATPWDAHVNEGEVEWPPSQWRLSRALIAVWHRKLDPSSFPEEKLERLLGTLTGETPVYRLPPAVHAHTRHYMPGSRFGPKPGDRDMVFDAFARVDPDEPLVMAWPGLELDSGLRPLLDELMARLGYLGRAESWVRAERLSGWQDWDEEADCRPGENTVDPETGEVLGEIVMLDRPRTRDGYAVFREEILDRLDELDVSAYQRRWIETTLPEAWLDALRVETGNLKKAGWDQPPAMRREAYVRPDEALSPPPSSPSRPSSARSVPTTASFAMYGRPLPRFEDAVQIGELLRAAVMSRARQTLGEDEIPSLLSGHDLPEDNEHGHAFYLPEDRDGDGHIDHLVVHVPNGLTADARVALDSLSRLWNRDGNEWPLVLEGFGGPGRFVQLCSYFGTDAAWRSSSPYLHPWHVKNNFTVEDQIRKECRLRELPAIRELTRVDSIEVGTRSRRPVDFRRTRSKKGLTQPDTHGSSWTITFERPVQGPLALGFSCHFGLGIFRPLDADAGGPEP